MLSCGGDFFFPGGRGLPSPWSKEASLDWTSLNLKIVDNRVVYGQTER